MPKLNTTVDNLELKTNRVTGSVPSADWTDAQYPSAKALYNTYNSLQTSYTGISTRCTTLESTIASLTTTCNNFINIAHPVGSIMITSTNTSPAGTVGGTWTLVDKGFTPYAASATNFFTPAANVTQGGTFVTRSGNTLRVRAALTINAEVSDNGLTLGTFNFSNIGITSLATDFTGSTCYSDGANCGISWNVDSATGVLTATDVFDSTKTTSGSAFSFDFTVPVIYTHMKDAVCNKFYWKRTA